MENKNGIFEFNEIYYNKFLISFISQQMLILVSQKFRTGGLAEHTRSDKKGKFLAHRNFKKNGISSAFLAIHGATQ